MTPRDGYTVVIATRGTADALERISRHITSLPLGTPVIILLNRPSQPPQCRLAELRASHDHLRVRFCPGGGVARARNLGLRTAETDTIVFLDDDVIPSALALNALVAELHRTSGGVATGRVVASPSSEDTFVLYRDLVGLDRGSEPRFFGDGGQAIPKPTSVWSLGVGAAFAVQRSALDAAACPPIFDETLSNGRLCGGAEDVDFFLQCLHADVPVVYAATAIFEHCFPRTEASLRLKMTQYARADGAFYAKWRDELDAADVAHDLQGWGARLHENLGRRRAKTPSLPMRSLVPEPIHKTIGAIWWRFFAAR